MTIFERLPHPDRWNQYICRILLRSMQWQINGTDIGSPLSPILAYIHGPVYG